MLLRYASVVPITYATAVAAVGMLLHHGARQSLTATISEFDQCYRFPGIFVVYTTFLFKIHWYWEVVYQSGMRQILITVSRTPCLHLVSTHVHLQSCPD